MSPPLPSWGPSVPADCSAEAQCRVWWEGLFLSLRLPPSGLKPLTSACKCSRQLLAFRLAPGLAWDVRVPRAQCHQPVHLTSARFCGCGESHLFLGESSQQRSEKEPSSP